MANSMNLNARPVKKCRNFSAPKCVVKVVLVKVVLVKVVLVKVALVKVALVKVAEAGHQ